MVPSGKLVCLCLFFWGAQLGASWGAELVRCEDGLLQFLLVPELQASLSGVKLLGHGGDPHPLRNDSVCGTLVTPNPDGSLAVTLSLAGCYVRVQDGSYWTTIQMDGLGANGQMTSYKEQLRCPEHHLALDSPTPGLCSSIPTRERLLCGARQVSQGECEDLGCCYDPRARVAPCYFGSKVTVRCTPDGQFSIAVSRNATFPPLSLDSVRLLSPPAGRCAATARNGLFVLFQFPVSACGTTFKESASKRLYENELVADRQVLESLSGSITRDSSFRLTVRCSYSAEASLPIGVQVATVAPLGAVAQQGPLTLEMRIAEDKRYAAYYSDSDYPVTKVLRDPIPIEVRILGRRDAALVLILHNCWATPSTNPMQKPNWPLLEDGCPYKGDNYQTELVPIGVDSRLQFPSHHQRFIVYTFTFVEGDSQRMLTGPVYFHCSASACVQSGQDGCSSRCNVTPQGRRQRAILDPPLPSEQLTLVSSDGPVDLSQATEGTASEGPEGLSRWGLVQWDVALIIVAATVAVAAVGTLAAVVLMRCRAWQELCA